MLKKQELRIVVEIIIGIIVSFIFNFLLIGYGYMVSNTHHLSNHTVKFLNMSVYSITNFGKNGSPNTTNMMFIGIIFSCLFVILGEMLYSLIIKKRRK